MKDILQVASGHWSTGHYCRDEQITIDSRYLLVTPGKNPVFINVAGHTLIACWISDSSSGCLFVLPTKLPALFFWGFATPQERVVWFAFLTLPQKKKIRYGSRIHPSLTIEPTQKRTRTCSTSFWTVNHGNQEMKATKKTKSLAVSNFSPEQLDCILADPAASADEIMVSWSSGLSLS